MDLDKRKRDINTHICANVLRQSLSQIYNKLLHIHKGAPICYTLYSTTVQSVCKPYSRTGLMGALA